MKSVRGDIGACGLQFSTRLVANPRPRLACWPECAPRLVSQPACPLPPSREGPKSMIETTTPLSSWQQGKSFWEVMETRLMREVDLTSADACHYERFTFLIAAVFRSARGRTGAEMRYRQSRLMMRAWGPVGLEGTRLQALPSPLPGALGTAPPCPLPSAIGWLGRLGRPAPRGTTSRPLGERRATAIVFCSA